MTDRKKTARIAALMQSLGYETAQKAVDKFNDESEAADAALFSIMDAHGLARVIGLENMAEERAKRAAVPEYAPAKAKADAARDRAKVYRAALLRTFKKQANATTRARIAAQRAAINTPASA